MSLHVAHTVSSIEHMGSGITYCVDGLAQAQARCGVKTEVFSLGHMSVGNSTAYLDKRFANDLSHVPLLKKLGLSGEMRRALYEANPDVVHSHGLWMLPNIYRTRRAQFVVSSHGMLAPVALSFSPGKKRVFRALFQDKALAATRLFHATAESEYDDIRSFGLSQPVAIIPNGIDLPAPAPVLYSNKTVLALGRLHPVKALDTLVRAWAAIEPVFPDWSLRIVGPDEAGHSLELLDLIRELRLATVMIEPPVYGDDKAALMAAADLFALSSHSENFGMTVAESLASGVPVISTKGAPWSGLETNRCGWWIDHGHEPLAATLATALRLPEAERRAMGARGREWMARDFGWDGIAAQMSQVYDWLLGRGDRPDCVRF